MIVVDTCIWIEFLKGKEPYFSNLSELLEQGQVLGLEIIFAELMQGAKNKREREFISNYWNYLPKFSIDSVFYKAGLNSSQEKWFAKGVGLIDCAILIYVRETGSFLWTKDKKLLKICKRDDLFEA